MSDNVLAQVPRRRYPSQAEQMAQDVRNYLQRLQSDFVTSGERAGKGLGQVLDDGNYLEGVPRVVLGGLGAIGAPVSAAVSPVLGPLLQPVGEAVDTYVGQPIERGTGYPADITNELFLTAATAGLAPVARPALRGAGNFLAKAGDAVEGAANRAGYTFARPEGALFSGAGPVRRGGGDLQFDADGNQLLPFADETNIPSKEQYRAQHQAYMQRALRENVPDLFYHGSPEDIYARGGFRLNYGEDNVPAVWATSNPLSAEDYARGAMSSQYDEAAGRYPIIQSNYKDLDALQGGVYGLKPTYKNPMFVDMDGKPFDGSKNSILKRAKEAGHDAVVFRNAVDNLFAGGVPADVVAFLDDKAFVPSRSGAGPVKLADDTGLTLYHGTGKEAADQIQRGGFKIFGGGDPDQFPIAGISTTPNKSTAQFYAAGENYLKESDRLDPVVMQLRVAGDKSLFPSFDRAIREFEATGGAITDEAAFLQFLKGKGYKGVRQGEEYRVFDPADIQVVDTQPMRYGESGLEQMGGGT